MIEDITSDPDLGFEDVMFVTYMLENKLTLPITNIEAPNKWYHPPTDEAGIQGFNLRVEVDVY